MKLYEPSCPGSRWSAWPWFHFPQEWAHWKESACGFPRPSSGWLQQDATLSNKDYMLPTFPPIHTYTSSVGFSAKISAEELITKTVFTVQSLPPSSISLAAETLSFSSCTLRPEFISNVSSTWNMPFWFLTVGFLVSGTQGEYSFDLIEHRPRERCTPSLLTVPFASVFQCGSVHRTHAQDYKGKGKWKICYLFPHYPILQVRFWA